MPKKIIIFIMLCFCLITLFPNAVLAQTPPDNTEETTAPETSSLLDNLKSAGTGAKYEVKSQSANNAIPNTIGQIVAIVLSFVGSIFLILTVFSGFQWMTAGGNEDKVKQARTRLINSIMGLVITVAAYFITYLISTTLLS